MVKANPNLAWLVQTEDRFGTRLIVAQVVIPQENGELHSPGTYRFDAGHEFDGFSVSVYLGETDSSVGMRSHGSKLWGLTHEFKRHNVDSAEKARDMVRVFDRIERAMKRVNESAGYLDQDDYLGYLTRIGAALGITRFYVRNHREARERSGENYRNCGTSVPDFQSWLHYTQQLAETKPGELSFR